jgi:hypothetical protein
MKGIIFNLLEEVTDTKLGDGAWDQLLDATRLEGAYTSLGSYPDAELLALVEAVQGRLGKSQAEVLRWFGSAAVPPLTLRYPAFFEGHRSLQTFMLTLNEVIHREVRKIYAGADAPDFGFELVATGRLVMSYVSSRGLCMFAEGLIHGTAAHFGEEVALHQTECMQRGEARCVFDLSFQRRGA